MGQSLPYRGSRPTRARGLKHIDGNLAHIIRITRVYRGEADFVLLVSRNRILAPRGQRKRGSTTGCAHCDCTQLQLQLSLTNRQGVDGFLRCQHSENGRLNVAIWVGSCRCAS
jgi:hypothetical protein